METLTLEPIAQIIGFIAFGLGVAAFLQKQDRHLKILLTIQAATLGIHFILLGAYTGAASALVAAARNFLSLFGRAKNIAPLFYIAILGFGYCTYDSAVDVFPILAGLVSTTALFFLNGMTMRLFFVTSSGLWLIHNIAVGSIGPAFMEAFMMGAGLFRAYMLHTERNRSAGCGEALTP
jgi:hypothetical protein